MRLGLSPGWAIQRPAPSAIALQVIDRWVVIGVPRRTGFDHALSLSAKYTKLTNKLAIAAVLWWYAFDET